MADSGNHDPITLANVDQYLDPEGLFLPHDDVGHDHTGPTPLEIDAAIKNASDSLMQHHDSSSLDGPSHGGVLDHGGHVIDPSLMDSLDAHVDLTAAKAESSNGTTIRRTHNQAYKRKLLPDDAIEHPQANLAPFIKPQRTAESPHPEQLLFGTRNAFEDWLKGESSWCHYVQRRVTNPEKRAEERLKSRIRAHERTLAAMAPEQAANAPPLKRRRRNRTSAVIEKVTYTCHHAGNYSSKHSESLPAAKLRMNTKQSVKCSCSSRIVMTEVDGGECQVMYYWKHEGHDPFASAELEAGRLPKLVDEWLNEQVRLGASVDEIRAKLDMNETDKAEYIRKANEDPSSVTPDMPPPLALSVVIKYPDIYNRFRKIRGAIKETKVPKSQRAPRKRKATGSASAALTPDLGGDELIKPESQAEELPVVHTADGGVIADADNNLDSHGDAEAPTMLHSEDVDHQFDEHLARLASDGQLAEALLQLPQSGGEGDNGGSVESAPPSHQSIGVGTGTVVGLGSSIDLTLENEEEANLREAVFRMARAERAVWDSMVQQ